MLQNKRPIIIQGAMNIEVEYLLKIIEIESEEEINGFKFYIGNINDYPVIISETHIGIINVSMATCIAIQKYNPIAIVNQGIAGSHVENIHKYDVVVGEKSVNVNSFITGIKNKGEGSTPFEWQFDNRSFEVSCDKELLEIAKKMQCEKYKLHFGILGSGDIFNREIDRIKWIHERKNTFSEDNESIAVYTICDRFGVPCIGLRTITNNEVTQKESDGSTCARRDLKNDSNKMITKKYDIAPAEKSQELVIEYVKVLIENIRLDFVVKEK